MRRTLRVAGSCLALTALLACRRHRHRPHVTQATLADASPSDVVAPREDANVADVAISDVGNLDDALVADSVSSGPPVPIERRAVSVDDVEETWRLEWREPPEPWRNSYRACGGCLAEYGETGRLRLMRLRGGYEMEHLDLDAYFSFGTFLRRWDVADERACDRELVDADKTKPISTLQLHDYDHDGRETEFLLQTMQSFMYADPPIGGWPPPSVPPLPEVTCNRPGIIAVGLDRRSPHLHALGTAEHPWKPLVTTLDVWTRILQAKEPLDVFVDDTPWGDAQHPATQTWWRVRWDDDGLHVTQLVYEGSSREKLRSSTTL